MNVQTVESRPSGPEPRREPPPAGRTLLVAPAPQVARARAYPIPRQPAHIDLRLDGTERPIASLAAAHAGAVVEGADACRYPDPRELEAALAWRYGISAEQVMVSAGADETLDRTCRAVLCPGREVILPEPSFEMLAHYAGLAGGTVQRVPWPAGDYPVGATLERVSAATALIVVVSPNNPTGAAASAEAIRRLAEGAPGALVLLDLAYGEYAEDDPTPAVLALPNVLVARTFSKAWGMPGARVGYALGDARVIAWLRAAGGPYSVARPSLRMALARLGAGAAPRSGGEAGPSSGVAAGPSTDAEVGDGHDQEVRSYIGRVRRERAAMRELVLALGGEAEPSQSNFVLARFGERAAWVREALAGLGIGVRVFSGNPALAGAARIACPGEEQAFARLERALKAALTPQALLLDMDGVLADVSGSYREAIRATAAAFGVTVTAADISHAKAAGDANNDWVLTWRLIAAAGVEVSLDEVTTRFEMLYQGSGTTPGLCARERLIPELELMQRLKGRFRLGVVTGRPRRDAERFLRQARLSELVSAMVCMEDGPLKPDPAPVRACLAQLGVEHAWLVGDTVDDLRAARRAGVVPLAVLAPGEADEAAAQVLRDAGAARLLGGLSDLLEILP